MQLTKAKGCETGSIKSKSNNYVSTLCLTSCSKGSAVTPILEFNIGAFSRASALGSVFKAGLTLLLLASAGLACVFGSWLAAGFGPERG